MGGEESEWVERRVNGVTVSCIYCIIHHYVIGYDFVIM